MPSTSKSSSLRAKEPAQPVSGWSPCVDYLSIFQIQYVLLHLAQPQHLVFMTARGWGMGVFQLNHKKNAQRAIPGLSCPKELLTVGTNTYSWYWFCSASSQCECNVVPSIVWLCLTFLDNSDTKMQWTEVFELRGAGGCHCNDLCYPPCSWSPPLTFITNTCRFCPTGFNMWFVGRSNSAHDMFKVS